MRIALITESFLPRVGGGELVVHNLAVQWSRQGHEVCVINAVSDRPTHPDANYQVRRYNVLRGTTRLGYHWLPYRLYHARLLRKEIARFRPDVISAHFGYPVGVWLSGLKPLPGYLLTCHGRELTTLPWGHRRTYGIDALLVRALDLSLSAIAISSHAKSIMVGMGVLPGKIALVPNGVDIARFRREVTFSAREHFGLPSDATIVLSVGRNHPQKAYDQGLLGFAGIARDRQNVYYLLLGRETQSLLSLARGLGIEKNVVLCPGLEGDALVGAYQQADIFLSSSVWEMMPLAVLEAMASGLPIVATDVSGSQDLVTDGRNGFLVQPSRPDQITGALARLLDSPCMRRTMGRVNLTLSEQYSWENVCRSYLKCAQAGAQGGLPAEP